MDYPIIEAFDSNLKNKISEYSRKRGKDYKPRTKHFENGRPKFTNRLFLENSPYLLQHAHNPVNWYPWGEEAFKRAEELKLPIMLSIGYSTCHWCHVMEEESFEDLEIAKYLNQNFVAIKLDREERPDIDAIYMNAVQALTGRGGWPLNVWLTHDRLPFFGGTYFPARDGDRGARVGFLTLLGRISERFKTDPLKVLESSKKIEEIVQNNFNVEKDDQLPDFLTIKELIGFYKRSFDSAEGGMNRAPKFPSSLPMGLLMREYSKNKDPEILNMITLSLKKMAKGGMYDQVGGGFHRYSVDKTWLVPHFEKMLYDNALLVPIYLEVYQLTKDEFFKEVAIDILAYVEKEMMNEDGLFYSATDADSETYSGEKEEGFYFTWSYKELEALLSKEELEFLKENYGVSSRGNFEGRNILFRKGKKISNELKLKLYNERNKKRKLPLRDDKVLTSWNALMISAFSKAAQVLGEKRYLEISHKALKFFQDKMLSDNHLYRVFNEGERKIKGTLNDYSFFIKALLDTYEAGFDGEWMNLAVKLDKHLMDEFEDPQNGGYFMTANNAEKLFVRQKPNYDGAQPSGNSITYHNLIRLNEFTTDDFYRQRANKLLKSLNSIIKKNPAAMSVLLEGLYFQFGKVKQIIIASQSHEKTKNFINVIKEMYLPNKIVAVVDPKLSKLYKIIPILKDKTCMNGEITAYVCERGVCKEPTGDLEKLRKQLAE